MAFPVRRALGRAGLIAAMLAGGVVAGGLPVHAQQAPSEVTVVHNAPVPNDAIGDQSGTVSATPVPVVPPAATGGAATSPDISVASEPPAAPEMTATSPDAVPPSRVMVVHNAPVPNDDIGDQKGTVTETPATEMPPR